MIPSNRYPFLNSYQEEKAAFLSNAFDSIDASLWLITGARYPQALSMLHNSFVLALKAELIGSSENV